MLRSLAAWICLLAYTAAVDITFMKGDDCSAYGVFGATQIPSVTCYDITIGTQEVHRSVDVRNFSPEQVVRFFSDVKCSNELFSTADDECYSTRDVAAFTVQNITETRTNQKSQTSSDESSTTEVSLYGTTKLSSYEGLEFTPGVARIPFSNPTIALATRATAASLSFALGVLGCYSLAAGVTPLGVIGCVGPFIVSILVWVSHFFRDTRTVGHVDAALGTITNVYHNGANVRRDIDSATAQYVHAMMDASGGHASHNGLHMKRDFGQGEQTSPIYELVNPGTNDTYFMSAFWHEESGSFVHHIALAESTVPDSQENSNDKRQDNYLDIRWSQNGMDFSFCPRNPGASTSILGKPIEDLYDVFYQEFKCTVDEKRLGEDQQLLVDIYNDASQIVGEVHITPYQDGGPVTNNKYVITECSQVRGALNQQCIA